MFMLYGLLSLMLIVALSFIAVPFIKTKKLNFKKYVIIAFLTIFISCGLYLTLSDQGALRQWLTQGKEHYQLIEEYNQLGGIDGIIASIKTKLSLNPNDSNGWLILGKLYLAQKNIPEAKIAFTNAHDLNPNDLEINRFYEAILKENH